MLKSLLIMLACMISLTGCNQSDESLRVQGTRKEIAESIAIDIQNIDYDHMNDKYVFTDRMDDFVSDGRIEGILEPMFSSIGTITGFEESYETEEAGYYLIHIPTHFDTTDYNIRVTFDQEDKIHDINIEEYALQE